MNDSIPDLKIELSDDDQGDGLILLEQDSFGNIDRVAIHPIRVRYMAEKMGLLPLSNPQAAKTIATSQRRMMALRDRLESLADWIAKYSDHKHANLSHETTQFDAVADLAREWCHDLDNEESEQVAHSSSLSTVDSQKPTQCTPAPAAQAELL